MSVKTTAAASEYRVDFYFTNLTKKDFRNYTIMAGNIEGYDVFKFAIKEERGMPIKAKNKNVELTWGE